MAPWNGMGSPPLPFLHLPPLQIDGFADGVGRRSLFPESKSNSFVIHCVAGTSRREDGWMHGRTDGRMAATEGAGYQECSRRLFCGPSSKRKDDLAAVPTLHFHFVDAIRVLSLILTFPMTLEALRRKGHRRSPPFDSPPRSAVPWPCIHMHLTIFRRKVCLTAVCIQ